MAVSDMRIQVGDTGGEVYELSVTTEARVSVRNSVSRYKVESEEVVTDNSVVNNREITYNGIITSIRRTDQGSGGSSFNVTGAVLDFFDLGGDSNFKDPRTFLEGLDQVRRNRQLVTCFLPNNITPIGNCLIENFEYVKDQSGGLTSWNVSLRLYEIRLAQAAQATSIPAPANSQVTSPEQDAGNATVDDITPQGIDTTILQQGADSFFNGLG